MSEPWYRTETDEQTTKFSSDFWLRHRHDLDAGEFWADRIKSYRGEPVERLRIAVESLPLPGAFREATIATRALIREKRKENQKFDEELALLYWLAAVNSFSVPYSEVLQQPGYNVVESIPGKVLKSLPFTYDELGYEKLEILNKTDVKWLKEAWGEPVSHNTLNDLHKDVWKDYELKLKRLQQKNDEEFIRSLTDMRPTPRTTLEYTAPKRNNKKWFYIALIVFVIVSVLVLT